ncbi:PTS lactose/cellobiose transporter subunit IIA [Lacrimispora indolis]|jgi:PTS system cellobiose-specific IIA component|uniref:PTS lactose/cellobiose transporter subunit IIA n=1 Tax=Lacrimispora indolis TaxID=69825 RepID=UPI00041D3029|nr:PTS lactose/cellobiose transporter subunit IIA [[Clostridium] methoxybenzovorans]MDR2023350.1 PTS lactose/cellobiose transporter subunit IIA [Hungatella sp.]
MDIKIETIMMELVVNGGNARSCALQAIAAAREGKFELADKQIKEAEAAIEKAHEFQTDILQAEASGEHLEMSLIMVHAQDHLMNSMTVRDLANEFIKLYKKADVPC